MTGRNVGRLLLAGAAVVLVLGAARWVPVDGVAHGGGLRLLGRLHPLVVHFPIVLLLAVPVLEWAGWRRPAWKEAAGFALGLALVSAVAAVVAGLTLTWTDGQEGPLLSTHLKGGVSVAVGTALAWGLRPIARTAYLLVLLPTVGLLAWAAHNGGSLTHGSTYLTEPLPAIARRMMRISDPSPPESYPRETVYGGRVRPLIEQRCLSCHGEERQKGDYRMDTYPSLLAGGKSGHPAIVPGDLLRSEMLRRIALDPSDDQVMPPRSKPRLKPADVALLHAWVKQGASRDLRQDAFVFVPPAEGAAAPTPSDDEADAKPAVGDYSALTGEISRWEVALGVRIVPVSRRPGDGLVLRASGLGTRFGDAELARLAPLAPFIVEAELGQTGLTDRGLAALAPYAHLSRLHLEQTAVDGTGLGELRNLPHLTYLNLCGTRVTDERIADLASAPALQHLYLFGSRVTPAAVAALHRKLPGCQIGSL
jgi:uncharacterized membrane protein/mono/diheme cytochrome c family protein